jgi:hypothetical protein
VWKNVVSNHLYALSEVLFVQNFHNVLDQVENQQPRSISASLAITKCALHGNDVLSGKSRLCVERAMEKRKSRVARTFLVHCTFVQIYCGPDCFRTGLLIDFSRPPWYPRGRTSRHACLLCSVLIVDGNGEGRDVDLIIGREMRGLEDEFERREDEGGRAGAGIRVQMRTMTMTMTRMKK